MVVASHLGIAGLAEYDSELVCAASEALCSTVGSQKVSEARKGSSGLRTSEDDLKPDCPGPEIGVEALSVGDGLAVSDALPPRGNLLRFAKLCRCTWLCFERSSSVFLAPPKRVLKSSFTNKNGS